MIRKFIFPILRISLSLAIIIYLFTKKIDTAQFLNIIKEANLTYLVMAYLSYALVCFLGIIRWGVLLKVQDIKIKFTKLIKFFYIGLFFNNFTLGSTGGDIVKAYYAARQTEKKPEAVTTVFADRMMGIFALMLIAFAGLFLNLQNPRFKKPVLIIFAFFLVGGLVTFSLFSKKFLSKIPFLKKIINYLPLKEKIKRAYEAFYLYKSHKKVLFKTIFYSLILQIIMVLINYGIGEAIGIRISLRYYFLLIPIVAILASIPISVSGWGVGEALYASFFGLIGVGSSQAVALSVLLRFTFILWGLLGGIMYIFPGSSKILEK
jgi:uncharacterized protein (TIRG00374 family)